MRKIREVLRLSWGQGRSIHEVARSCSLARSTVGDYLRRARGAGLAWPLPEGLDDAALEARLFPSVRAPGGERPLPDWDVVDRELKRGRGVTLQLLWEEYRERHPDGYAYSRFCDHFRVWRQAQEVVMRLTHRAGEKLFVDYAGQTAEVVDAASGEVREAPVFVAVLGASSYAYCEATWTQALPDWTMSHVRALEHFGGAPAIIVPDNLKAAVTSPHLYEPDLNPTYVDFARHYGVAVIPARRQHPRDKAKVESGVRLVGMWILARLRNRTFFSLSELNAAIGEQLTAYNERAFQQRPGSRRALFLDLDRPALRPLPAARYEFAEWRKARAHVDYHVTFEQHRYSVPYQLVNQELDLRITSGTVEVFHRNRRVASHARSSRRGAFTTVSEHMPEPHRAYLQWTPERLITWSETAGPATAELITKIMASRPHPQQGFRSCLGILRLGKTCGQARLEAASRRALALGALSYRSVEAILKHHLENQPLSAAASRSTPIEHANIRGGAYYAGDNDDSHDRQEESAC
jgi:transposase